MASKISNYGDYNGLNSVMTTALLEVYSFVDIKPKELASILDVNISTIHKSIGKKRVYAPGIPMVQCLLEIFEDRKPGVTRYYGLRIAGAGKAIAQKKAFGEIISEIDSEPGLDDELQEDSDFELSLDADEAINAADEFASCEMLIACLNRHFSNYRVGEVSRQEILEEIDFDILFNLFLDIYQKPGFSNYLAMRSAPKTFAESLVISGLELGARLNKIGAGLTHQQFGELMLGFSPNLVTQSDLKATDAKTIEAKSSTRLKRQRTDRQGSKK